MLGPAVCLLSLASAAPPSSTPATDVGSSTSLPRVAVVVVGLKPDSADAKALRETLRKILEEGQRASLLPQERELFLFASRPKQGTKVRSTAAATKRLLARAKRAFESFDLAEAHKAVEEARARILPFQGTKAFRVLDRTRLQLAVSIAHAQRETETAAALLSEYALRHADDRPPAGGWPPEVLTRLAALEEQPRAELIVEVLPSNAEVFVDGRSVGSTSPKPVSVLVGKHRVEVVAAGHVPHDGVIELDEATTEHLRVELAPDFSAAFATNSLEADTVARLLDVAQREKIEHVIVANLRADGQVELRRLMAGVRNALLDRDLASGAGRPESRLPDPVVVTDRRELSRVTAERLLREPLPLAIAQETTYSFAPPAWAWITAGGGVLVGAAGVAFRVAALDTQDDYRRQLGSITQVRAFEMRDRAESQAESGLILLSVGTTAVVTVISYLIYDWMVSASP